MRVSSRGSFTPDLAHVSKMREKKQKRMILNSPGELVAIVDPEVGGFTELSLHSLGMPDFAEKNTLFCICTLTPGYVVLVDSLRRDGGDIVRVEVDEGLGAKLVHTPGAFDDGFGNLQLVLVNEDIIVLINSPIVIVILLRRHDGSLCHIANQDEAVNGRGEKGINRR